MFLLFIKVSSDMSTVDIELAHKLSIAVGADVITSTAFVILAILAWPVIFVIIPLICLTMYLKVIYSSLLGILFLSVTI